MTSLLPPVRAALQERYLFNFRMPAAVFSTPGSCSVAPTTACQSLRRDFLLHIAVTSYHYRTFAHKRRAIEP